MRIQEITLKTGATTPANVIFRPAFQEGGRSDYRFMDGNDRYDLSYVVRPESKTTALRVSSVLTCVTPATLVNNTLTPEVRSTVRIEYVIGRNASDSQKKNLLAFGGQIPAEPMFNDAVLNGLAPF